MKALISAYACEPGRGSEPGVGWNVVRELSARHELWVLTRANHEAAIRGSGEAWVERVRWIFLDPPAGLTFWKKGGRGLRVFYFLWQRQSRRVARRLMAEHAFEVVHHLTFGNFLPPSPLADLGPPFVCGPLGGGETMPPALLASSGWRLRLAEGSRARIRRCCAGLPWVRQAYRGAAVCLAATPETAVLLSKTGAARVRVQHQSGLSVEEMDHFDRLSGALPADDGPLKLVAASRLVGWKAIDLVIEAVGRALARGIDVRLTVLQEGPERARLEELARQLGLTERVVFRGRLPDLDEVHREIAAADALIHPAVHEVFGQICLEAMALGVPVICLDWCGPGRIVDAASGHKVAPGPRPEVIEGLADAIERVLARRGQRADAAVAAKSRVRREFGWEPVVQEIETAWLDARAGVEGNRD